MRINVKDLLRGGYDPTPTTPKDRFGEVDPQGDTESIASERNWYGFPAAEVLSGLDKIAQKYHDSVQAKAKAYAAERYKGDFKGNDELYDEAKAHVDGIYEGKEESLRETRDAKVGELSVKKQQQGADRAAALKNLGKNYLAAEGWTEEALARRGLSHSSIAALSRENLRQDYDEAVEKTQVAYDRKVDVLDKKIEQADAAYQAAMKNYEISYALKLEDKLNRLKTERDRAVKAYDAEHEKDRQAAYDWYVMHDAAQNQAYERQHADYTGEKKENYQERYDYLMDALKDRDKGSVSRFLSDHAEELKNYLGLYYERFIGEVS